MFSDIPHVFFYLGFYVCKTEAEWCSPTRENRIPPQLTAEMNSIFFSNLLSLGGTAWQHHQTWRTEARPEAPKLEKDSVSHENLWLLLWSHPRLGWLSQTRSAFPQFQIKNKTKKKAHLESLKWKFFKKQWNSASWCLFQLLRNDQKTLIEMENSQLSSSCWVIPPTWWSQVKVADQRGFVSQWQSVLEALSSWSRAVSLLIMWLQEATAICVLHYQTAGAWPASD